MDAKPRRAFAPDFAVPPGETVLEVLEAMGLSQIELAERTGRPKKTINEIIKGHAAITPETALQFERVLEVEAAFWTSLEHDYRAALARHAERERLEQQVGWLRELPVKAMIKAGWIEAKKSTVQQLETVLSFFGVASVEAWRDVWRDYRTAIAFRESVSFESDFGAMTSWLRRCELEARLIASAPYDTAAFKGALSEIRGLTTEVPSVFCPRMIDMCATAGVALVLVPELPHLRVCGATRWLSSEKALIALTLRYKRDDHFWFTFFHEAAHILLHGKRSIFVEEDRRAPSASSERSADDVARQEEEANRFSRDFLIPPADYAQFRLQQTFSAHAIRSFAEQIGIAPGIVVGRLQRDKILPFPVALNRLKRTFVWDTQNS
jgi:HTH-type transcriptional regulator/antitoxin HigA